MFILLRDTFGCGLVPFKGGLYAYDKDQLRDAIVMAASEIIEEDGYESFLEYDEDNGSLPLCESIVVFKVSDECGPEYIDSILLDQERKNRDEEYQQYLKLKDKFEKSIS